MAKQQTKTDRSIRAAKGAIHKALQSLKEDRERAIRRAQQIRSNRYSLIQPVLTKLALLIDEIPEDNKRIELDCGWNTPAITVALINQASLKSPTICALLEYAADRCSDYASSTDWVTSTWAERCHVFSHNDLTIRVSIDVADDATCRRVLVGTETKTVDKYQFVCEE